MRPAGNGSTPAIIADAKPGVLNQQCLPLLFWNYHRAARYICPCSFVPSCPMEAAGQRKVGRARKHEGDYALRCFGSFKPSFSPSHVHKPKPGLKLAGLTCSCASEKNGPQAGAVSTQEAAGCADHALHDLFFGTRLKINNPILL
jgi:hypothetical protein